MTGVEGERLGRGREARARSPASSPSPTGPWEGFEQRSGMTQLAFLKVVASGGEKWAESGNLEPPDLQQDQMWEPVKSLGPQLLGGGGG